MMRRAWQQLFVGLWRSQKSDRNGAKRRSASRHGIENSRCATAAELLEERLLLSVVAIDFSQMSHEEWREQTFTVDPIVSPEQDAIDFGQEGGVELFSEQSTDLIGLPDVFASTDYRGSGYSVAILDTGIDYNHGNLGGGWGNRVVAGYDFVNDDTDPNDDHGHGTHVAGIVGSDHETYTGIAPEVNLIALKVLGSSGSGSFGDVEDALQWVIDNRETYNIVATNLSLGAGNYSTNPLPWLDDEFSTLEDNGVFVAVASGNSFYTYSSAPGLATPAVSDYTVSVGAVWDSNAGSATWSNGAKDYSTDADRITSFTQRSSALDILAPGANVKNTYRGGGFRTLAGTSMASPMIAGSAALLHEALVDTGQSELAFQDDILAIMKETGVDVNDGDDEDDNVENTGLTFKRLDLAAAMASILEDVTSPIVQTGSTVDVYGTTGADTFTFTAGSTFTVSVNGTEQSFSPAEISAIHFHGDDGEDTLSIVGTAADETAVLSVGSVVFTSDGFVVDGANVENIDVDAGSGYDEATLYDSAGNDRFTGTTTYARLKGAGFVNFVSSFDRVSAYASNGGADDRASLYDSAGNDRFTGNPDLARLRGDGFDNYVNGFDMVTAYATAGGTDDRAYFTDSDGDDRYIASPEDARLKGDTFNNLAVGFDRTYAYATEGGDDDRATFYDSAGNDRFFAKPTDARLRGPGFNNFAKGFERTYAYATAGGTDDRATFFDSAGDDRFLATADYARMRGDGFNNYGEGFDRVYAKATAGGADDRAFIYDSVGNDTFVGMSNEAWMTGDGFYNHTTGFDSVEVFATAGGEDDRVLFYDTVGDDLLSGEGSSVNLTGDGFGYFTDGFDYVKATSSEGGTDSVDVGELDAVFETVGDWLWL